VPHRCRRQWSSHIHSHFKPFYDDDDDDDYHDDKTSCISIDTVRDKNKNALHIWRTFATSLIQNLPSSQKLNEAYL